MDEQGGIHYAGSLDEVPPEHRAQFVRPLPRTPVAPVRTPAPPQASTLAPPALPTRPEPAPIPSQPQRHGRWIVATPEGYFRAIDEARCQRIADSASTRFKRAYRCLWESHG